MKDKTKRILVASVGIALSAVLVFLIARELQPQPVIDEPIPQSTQEPNDVVVDDSVDTAEEKDETEVPPIDSEQDAAEQSGTSEDTATEQEIQPDAEDKPEITEEEKTDSTQTPDGEEVTPPTEENPTPPQTQDPPEEPQPPVNNGGGLPGFSDVPNLGENHGGVADSDGDINTQVGIM